MSNCLMTPNRLCCFFIVVWIKCHVAVLRRWPWWHIERPITWPIRLVSSQIFLIAKDDFLINIRCSCHLVQDHRTHVVVYVVYLTDISQVSWSISTAKFMPEVPLQLNTKCICSIWHNDLNKFSHFNNWLTEYIIFNLFHNKNS